MASKFLDGSMIPRSVKRMFDQRGEQRSAPDSDSATFEYEGRRFDVRLVNISPSGAMVICPAMPHIGARVRLQLQGRKPAAARVLWVRDGRVGVGFDDPLDC